MLARFSITTLLVFSLGLGAVSAKEPEAKPKPDFHPYDIVLPAEGLNPGANKLKVLIENRSKDSEVTGKISFELVILSLDGTRQSFPGEFDAMRFGQKREATLENVDVGAVDTVRFLLIVDPENLVEESNEDNNRYFFQAKVKTPKAEEPATKAPATKS